MALFLVLRENNSSIHLGSWVLPDNWPTQLVTEH